MCILSILLNARGTLAVVKSSIYSFVELFWLALAYDTIFGDQTSQLIAERSQRSVSF